MQCMEVWGGSQLTSSGVELGGLDVWVYSKPFGQAQRGGDVFYVSSCATGRISRLLLADVSGHGSFATAVVTTFFAPTRRLSLCNDGHPRPLLFHALDGHWPFLGHAEYAEK